MPASLHIHNRCRFFSLENLASSGRWRTEIKHECMNTDRPQGRSERVEGAKERHTVRHAHGPRARKTSHPTPPHSTTSFSQEHSTLKKTASGSGAMNITSESRKTMRSNKFERGVTVCRDASSSPLSDRNGRRDARSGAHEHHCMSLAIAAVRRSCSGLAIPSQKTIARRKD